tara:strand:+ start:64029 stop:66803 length:2775 start_codon:yes stop_codon:yes gene_type:complete
MQEDLQSLVKEQLAPHIEDGLLFDGATTSKLNDRLKRESDKDSSLSDIRRVDFADIDEVIHSIHRHQGLLMEPQKSAISKNKQHLQKIASVRNRVMHGRPLEFDDVTFVTELSKRLVGETPSFWHNLRASQGELADNPESVLHLDLTISPPETGDLLHNLPQPDFDDTGFIGRADKLEEAKNALLGPYPVITLHGEGGIGKSALATKLCYDFLDQADCPFEAIVWTSAKASRLTPNDIESIDDAIANSLGIFDVAAKLLDDGDSSTDPMSSVIEYLGTFPILLVIDNLETILDENIRKFVRSIPKGSKILFTSRVSLGSVDFPIQVDPLSNIDASHYFRRAAKVWSLHELSEVPSQKVNEYLKKLHYNPLFIKWFIQCVATGKSPNHVLANRKNILEYCMANVFDHLDYNSLEILTVMACTKPPHNQPILQYYSNLEYDDIQRSLSLMLSSNIISNRLGKTNGEEIYEISNLANSFLRNYIKIDAEKQKEYRAKEGALIAEQGRFLKDQTADPYNIENITVRNKGDFVVARHLRDASRAIKKKNLKSASDFVAKAESVAPDFFEVKRFRAAVAAYLGDHIGARENYEAAISLAPDHAPLYLWYGGFLFREENDVEGALVQYGQGLALDTESQELLIEYARMELYSMNFPEARTDLDRLDFIALSEKRKRIFTDIHLQTYTREIEWHVDQGELPIALEVFRVFRASFENTKPRWIDSKTREHLARGYHSILKLVSGSRGAAIEGDSVLAKDWYEVQGLVPAQFTSLETGTELAVTPIENDSGDVGSARSGEIVELRDNYGFIDDTVERYFFHRGEWLGCLPFESLFIGQNVHFNIGENYRGKCAVGLFESMSLEEWQQERLGTIDTIFDSHAFISEAGRGSGLFFRSEHMKYPELFEQIEIGKHVKFRLGLSRGKLLATDVIWAQ